MFSLRFCACGVPVRSCITCIRMGTGLQERISGRVKCIAESTIRLAVQRTCDDGYVTCNELDELYGIQNPPQRSSDSGPHSMCDYIWSAVARAKHARLLDMMVEAPVPLNRDGDILYHFENLDYVGPIGMDLTARVSARHSLFRHPHSTAETRRSSLSTVLCKDPRGRRSH